MLHFVLVQAGAALGKAFLVPVRVPGCSISLWSKPGPLSKGNFSTCKGTGVLHFVLVKALAALGKAFLGHVWAPGRPISFWSKPGPLPKKHF